MPLRFLHRFVRLAPTGPAQGKGEGMPRRPSPLPPPLGDTFSVRAAREAGVTGARLRARDLESPFSGVRRLRAPDEVPQDHDDSPTAAYARIATARLVSTAHAYGTVMSEEAFFCHVTAAAIWGLPLPLRVLRMESRSSPTGTRGERPIDVGVRLPRRGPRVSGVRTHRLAGELLSVREVGGRRVTSPATTWAQLAEELTVDELIIVGDAIVHQPRGRNAIKGAPGSGLATLDQLAAAATAGRRTGVEKLRQALPHIRAGSMSPPETQLRLAATRAGLPEPALDFDVLDPSGAMIGFTELAYPRWMILIEFEGDHHRVSRAQWDRDIEKHARCVELGWNVLRFTGRHVYPTPEPAVARIRAALVRAGWRSGPEPRTAR